ncbi:MAG TPA: Chromate resistance protein ChrB [Pseudonocardiaceae bacterium]
MPQWWVVSLQLPTEPSRHRVAGWRELRRAAAVSLSNGTWALPDGENAPAVLDRLRVLATAAAGEVYVFQTIPDEATVGQLRAAHVQSREAEWGEFLAECGKFEGEIDREFAQDKFTLAELDEEEQSLERLRRWYQELRDRDIFGAPSAPAATARLEVVTGALERYARAVYDRCQDQAQT